MKGFENRLGILRIVKTDSKNKFQFACSSADKEVYSYYHLLESTRSRNRRPNRVSAVRIESDYSESAGQLPQTVVRLNMPQQTRAYLHLSHTFNVSFHSVSSDLTRE